VKVCEDGAAIRGTPGIMRFLRNWLAPTLVVLAALSVAAIFLGQENGFARVELCSFVWCPHWSSSHAWEKIAYDLGAGSLISLFFYLLVVRVPDYQKRQRFKRSFRKKYQIFKEDCIAEMLGIADGTFMWGFHEELTDQARFREYFEQNVSQDQDRWDRLFNNLDDEGLRRIITHMEVFRDETAFILASIDIPGDEAFEFLQRLTSNILRVKKLNADYDSKKSFLNFLWDLFAGGSIATGYRDYDMIERAIDQI
jgi:hypothetical protein